MSPETTLVHLVVEAIGKRPIRYRAKNIIQLDHSTFQQQVRSVRWQHIWIICWRPARLIRRVHCLKEMARVVFAFTTGAETVPAMVKIGAAVALVSDPANSALAAVTNGGVDVTGVV